MKYLLLVIFLLFAASAFSAPVTREFRDLKLPTQVIMEKQEFTNPAAASAYNIGSGDAGATGTGAATDTTFIAQPDVPRNLVITPGSTTADVGTCVIVVTGTNFHNDAITENFTFAANDSAAQTGAKAFKTISSVAYPANCEDSPFGATWSMGYGEKLGLKRCLDVAGYSVFSTVAGAYESTRATIVADTNEIEKNTADFNGTMNASNDFALFFIQNFNSAGGNCFP